MEPIDDASAAKDRRARPREPESLPALLSIPSKLRLRKTRVVIGDYDSAGARFVSPSPLDLGRRVRLRFRMPKALCGPFSGLSCRVCGEVRACRRRADGKGFDVVIRWDEPISAAVAQAVRRHQTKVGAWIALTMIAIVWLKWDNMRFFWYEPSFYAFSFLVIAYFLSRFALCRIYKPPVDRGYEPTLSVVISVRDEEGAIARTVATCFAADYPDHKREVIVVDDGSLDGTREVLKSLAEKYPKLRVFAIPPTGKRMGMATGALQATGEFIVFVDSDTFLYPDALRQIVQGFEDPTLGAVAGRTEVENADKNALTGLQEVRYLLSFRLMKTAESVFDAVTCCPGSLSAYRREYVLAVLKPWLRQRFLGAKAAVGDDRSLTNFILRKYRVIYNAKAVSSTLVPETWRGYLRQQARWKKSWLRETLIAGGFMYKKHPVAALSFYTAGFCSIVSPLMIFRAAYLGFIDPQAFLSFYVIGLILVGLAQGLTFLALRPNSRWLLCMLMVASQVVVLGPQTYYALLTMRRNHWGTRSG